MHHFGVDIKESSRLVYHFLTVTIIFSDPNVTPHVDRHLQASSFSRLVSVALV